VNEHKTTTLAGDFIFLESPRWHDNSLWVSDIWDCKVYRVGRNGDRTVVCEVPERPSGLGFLSDRTPIVVSMGDRSLYKIVNGKLSKHADLSDIATGDLNDMLVDDKDRAYVGNFGYDPSKGSSPANANIALVLPDGSARVVADDLNFPNGAALLDGGRTFVVAETWARCLTAFDRMPDGSLRNRRVFANLGDRTPDGICADSEGGVWVSSLVTGEFIRVLGGTITDRILCVGKRAIACMLGGEDGRTLFCSTFQGELEDIRSRRRAGAIETVRVEIPAAGFARIPSAETNGN
jgi:sugar lactone lactonase YvrE